MKKIISLTIVFILCIISAIVIATPQNLKIQYDNKYPNTETQTNKPTTVLKGGISQIQELPSGMYGMWQVNGTLLETDKPAKYVTNSSDIWMLRKDGDFVSLINPENGATATITITEVKNNTATFIRAVSTYKARESEQVTVTLDDDKNFSGTDLIQFQYVRNGVVESDFARYKIKGSKISGQTIIRPKGATTTGNY